MIVKRRTFEAKNFPIGSSERARLNIDSATSEYMPSYRYVLRHNDGSHTPFTYRTKAEATSAATLKGGDGT